MSFTEQVERAKPIWFESAFALIFGVALVASITATDVSFHDDYVLNILSWCHADNQDAFCTDFREKHGLGITEQTDIGKKYWDRLAGQAVETFALMFMIRIGFAVMISVSRIRKKIRITAFLMAIVWGSVATTLFMFGVLDTLYYVTQFDKDFPEDNTFSWLDGAGVFQETKTWFGDPEHVDFEDLIATNLVGFGIIFMLILITVITFNAKKYTKLA